VSDRERWDRRYAGDAYVMGDGPKAFLTGSADHLPTSGAALDVACGEGQTAVWLAVRGLTVDAVDVSPVGLAKVRSLARTAGVAGRVHTHEHDLESGVPDLRADYALITCLHYYQPELMPDLRSLLGPGGVLLVELPTRAALRLGLPAPPARYLADEGEVRGFAEGLETLAYEEGVEDGRAVARLVARRTLTPARPT
jgi:SAM-dependent methyltransferase